MDTKGVPTTGLSIGEMRVRRDIVRLLEEMGDFSEAEVHAR